MEFEEARDLALELQANWKTWSDIDRGETLVVLLDEAGVTQRTLAKMMGCSEGLIRHLAIVGELPEDWKDDLRAGCSTRSVVAAWRQERREEEEEEDDED